MDFQQEVCNAPEAVMWINGPSVSQRKGKSRPEMIPGGFYEQNS